MTRVVVILAVLLAAPAVRAETPDVGVLVVGDTPLHGKLREHARAWVKSKGYMLVKAPMSEDAANSFDNCFVLEDMKCARGVFDNRSRSATLIYIGFDPGDPDAKTKPSLKVYWFTKEQPTSGRSVPCPDCDATFEKIVDDELVTLQAMHADLPVTKRPKASKVWPMLLLGSGIAAIGTGGVFLFYGTYGTALHDRDHKYTYPDAILPGIAFTAVGVGAAIGGIILLKQANARQSAPIASVGPGQAYVGWVTRF
ncbi:MAG TPA: hypothetical protein VMZ53_31265 [Kofleriaceae bacterium]|nr:hypothetical protein [Kofleriaceae bacterium]